MRIGKIEFDFALKFEGINFITDRLVYGLIENGFHSP